MKKVIPTSPFITYNDIFHSAFFRHLLVQGQHWKHENDVRNLLKVSNSVLIVNFEQILQIALVFPGWEIAY